MWRSAVVLLLAQAACAGLPSSMRDWQPDGVTLCSKVAFLAFLETPRVTSNATNVPCRFWSQGDLTRALAVSSYEQLRPLFAKLQRGQRVTLAVLGSSVSGYAGCFHSDKQAVFDALGGVYPALMGLPEFADCPADGPNRYQWASTLLGVINRTYPHPDHLLVNSAVGGQNLASFANAACMSAYVPMSADVLFLDQFEGGERTPVHDPSKRSAGLNVERLWFQISQQLERPVPTILMNFVVVAAEEDEHCVKPSKGDSCAACADFENHTYASPLRSFLLEEQLATTAAYYGWSMLSLRNMVVSMLRDGLPARLGISACTFVNLLFQDRVHPTYLGAFLLGEAVLQHFINAQAFFATEPAPLDPTPLNRPPAQSLVPGAWAFPNRTCLAPEAFVVRDPHNWAYHDSETVRGRRVAKPGWISSAPDGALSLELPEAAAHSTVSLQYLLSYSPAMGVATLSCAAGCRCPPQTVDSRNKEHVSVVASKVFTVDATPAGGACLLRLAIDAAAAPGHKVKLVSVSYEDRPQQ